VTAYVTQATSCP